MDIIKLEGEDERLYRLVAHLVMNEQVVKYNLGYPYKTSSEYLWFVAVRDGTTIGFMPVKLKRGKAKIDNYYVAGDDSAVFAALLKEVSAAIPADYVLESVTQVRHIPDFEKSGFSVSVHWKKYVKMEAERDG